MLRHDALFQHFRRRRTRAALRLTAALALSNVLLLAATPAAVFGQGRSDATAAGDTSGSHVGARDSAGPPGRALTRARRLRGAWVGAAFNSPAGKQLGMTPDRDFFLIGLRTTWSVGEHGPFGASWALELYPIAVVTNNPTRSRTQSTPGGTAPASDGGAPVVGAGFAPLGLELRYALHRQVRLMVTASGGALMFAREVPIPEARRFNFTLDYGAGIQIARGERQSVLIGYRYHHLSNAKTAARNPGLDANLFYLGVGVRQ